jgi:hypothetical protein
LPRPSRRLRSALRRRRPLARFVASVDLRAKRVPPGASGGQSERVPPVSPTAGPLERRCPLKPSCRPSRAPPVVDFGRHRPSPTRVSTSLSSPCFPLPSPHLDWSP